MLKSDGEMGRGEKETNVGACLVFPTPHLINNPQPATTLIVVIICQF